MTPQSISMNLRVGAETQIQTMHESVESLAYKIKRFWWEKRVKEKILKKANLQKEIIAKFFHFCFVFSLGELWLSVVSLLHLSHHTLKYETTSLLLFSKLMIFIFSFSQIWLYNQKIYFIINVSVIIIGNRISYLSLNPGNLHFTWHECPWEKPGSISSQLYKLWVNSRTDWDF